MLEREAPPDVESAGAGVLRVHLARRETVQAHPERKVSRLPPAPDPLQSDESADHVDETVAGSSAASPGDHYLSGKEVDFPAEFAQQVDFDLALQGLPVVAATVRVRIFVDAYGKVHKLDWQASKAPPDVIARLDGYLLDQPFRPARKAGQDVASVLTIEFEIGPPRIVQPGFGDVPVIQEASPPVPR